MDDLEAAANPSCPRDGTVMRDAPGAWVCSACEYRIEHPDSTTVVMPPVFDGPSIHGG